MTVEREVATNEDLSDLAGAVGAEVLDEMREATRGEAGRAPCLVTIEVEAEPVEEPEEQRSSTVTTEAGP